MSEVLESMASGAAEEPEKHPLLRSKNRLKLGSFSWSLQGGSTMTFAEGTIGELNWPQQVRIAKLTEAAGMDAIISVARWKGLGGPSGFHKESYDTIAWAGALAAETKTVSIFSTVHIPLFHPVRAAKSGATLSHISGGRFAYNIVAGWNTAEFAMFGKQQLSHEDRYAEAEEWVQYVKKLWAEDEPFDWNGKYYQGAGAVSHPKPLGPRPLIMSAGASPTGQAFAAKNADVIFIVTPSDVGRVGEMVRSIKAQAAQNGREVEVWLSGGLLCRPTDAEAQRAFDYFVQEKGDYQSAALTIGAATAGDSRSGRDFGADVRAKMEALIAYMSSFLFVGSPKHIVEQMSALADVGLDGVGFICQDFEKELEIFGAEIQPLAKAAGLMV